MQLEIKSRKLHLKGDQRCLAPCTPILLILFPNQTLTPVVLESLKKFSSQSSSKGFLWMGQYLFH